MIKERVEKTFEKELASFDVPVSGYRDFTVSAICRLPDYFLRQNQDGSDNAIVSHTKASVAFANVLFSLEEYQDMFTSTERDAIRSALMLPA